MLQQLSGEAYQLTNRVQQLRNSQQQLQDQWAFSILVWCRCGTRSLTRQERLPIMLYNPSASTLVRFRRPQTYISPASFAAALFARNEKLPPHYAMNRRSVSFVVARALQMTGLFCILGPAKMPFWISENAHGVGGSQESFTRQEIFRWEGISHLSLSSHPPLPSLGTSGQCPSYKILHLFPLYPQLDSDTGCPGKRKIYLRQVFNPGGRPKRDYRLQCASG